MVSKMKLLWFFAGFTLGAAAGMALAPAPGAQIRRSIGQKVSESGLEYMEFGRSLYLQGRSLADEAAEMFEDGRRLMEGSDA